MSGVKKVLDQYISTQPYESPARASRHHLDGYEAKFGPFLPAERGAAIVDVGVGMGYFLQFLEGKGYANLAGVDVGVESVKAARATTRATIEAVDDYRPYFTARRGHFDLISILGVLEHLPKAGIIDTLAAFHEGLRPGGMLLISTENGACYNAGWGRYIDFTHELAFTERSLYQVLRVAGFRDILIYEERPPFAWRPKRLAWLAARAAWNALLRTANRIQFGVEAPRIISQIILAAARKDA
jgi:2-polyprenyl-3-methyl-5-hydroxy-6-metoxy-1,4-benzoquinol methylase